MSALGKLRFGEGGYTMFYCPGCDGAHAIRVPQWTWNGNADRPTFSPSILVTGHDSRCHSFVREGNIEFLGDCTHAMAGQTVPLPHWPEGYGGGEE